MSFRKAIIFVFLYNALSVFAADTLQCSGSVNSQKQKDGIWLCRKGEQILKKERYKNGVLLTYIVYNEKGQIVETRNRRGKVKTYKPCGC